MFLVCLDTGENLTLKYNVEINRWSSDMVEFYKNLFTQCHKQTAKLCHLMPEFTVSIVLAE